MKEFNLKHIAKERNKLLIERELIKKERVALKKLVKNVALETQMRENIKEILGKPTDPVMIKPAETSKDGVRLDIIIADLHYSGTKDNKDVENLWKSTLTFVDNYVKTKKVHTIRTIFLGDDIEGELHLSQLDKSENTVSQIRGVIAHYSNLLESIKTQYSKTNLEVVFVPESNHGQQRVHGMQRGAKPRSDYGYIIKDALAFRFGKDMYFWADKDGIVETKDTYYMHGDKPFMKDSKSVRLVLPKKHIVMAHWHTFKISEHGEFYLIVAPSANNHKEDYAKEAGYAISEAQILTMVMDKKNKIKEFTLVEK